MTEKMWTTLTPWIRVVPILGVIYGFVLPTLTAATLVHLLGK